MRATAIIGDVGGYVDQLEDCLDRLGIGGDTWPDGLTVVQVGDLLGGNDDMACVRLVEPYMRAGRWIQLAGNWELEAVGGNNVTNDRGKTADSAALRIFKGWHQDGLVQFATAVPSRTGSTAIVTHAGLTREWWTTFAKAETDAAKLVQIINDAKIASLMFGGEMSPLQLTPPSPMWASTNELWASWSGHDLPWPLVHGHTAPYDWTANKWLTHFIDPAIYPDAKPNVTKRHLTWRPSTGSHPIIGIDPGLWPGAPGSSLHALLVTAE